MEHTKALGPVIDARTETLILGSFPSEESLRKQEYYGNSRNQFWRLIGECIGEELESMAYPDKLVTLLKHKIGVWDALKSCSRVGSLDSAIQNEKHNRFFMLTKAAPQLKRVCFNGKKAACVEQIFKDKGYETIVLPSSSPAHAIGFDEKVNAWKQLLS